MKAEKIWAGPADLPNLYVRFVSEFAIDRLPCAPVLRIRADRRYDADLNGREIPSQQYSDRSSDPVLDEVALNRSAFIAGKNVFPFLAYCQNEDSFTYERGGAFADFRDHRRGRGPCRERAFSGASSLCHG